MLWAQGKNYASCVFSSLHLIHASHALLFYGDENEVPVDLRVSFPGPLDREIQHLLSPRRNVENQVVHLNRAEG